MGGKGGNESYMSIVSKDEKNKIGFVGWSWVKGIFRFDRSMKYLHDKNTLSNASMLGS